MTEESHDPKIAIRPAQRADAPALLELIVALANFEKLAPPDAEAQRRLVEDAFGDRPRFESWLAFWEGTAVAYAITFETYSSFLARPSLYLEDIFVLPEFRGRGIGSALDWNTKAQATYEQLGARRMTEWFLYRLTRETMAEILSKPPHH
jgi:GNAT superfamily N-acetyltransferase